MDERQNPYAPGAGTQPPELAGRDAIIEAASIALDRIRGGLSARSFVFYGLRGVGKTVLLNYIVIAAEQRGHTCVAIEAPENRSLPALLVPPCVRPSFSSRPRNAREACLGESDGRALALASAAGRIVVTEDWGFGEMVMRRGEPAIGVVISVSVQIASWDRAKPTPSSGLSRSPTGQRAML